MSDTPEEAENYLRFILFFIDIATDIVRQVFHYLVNGDASKGDVTSYLQKEEIKNQLLDFKKKKKLSEEQYNLVRPNNVVINTTHFDISLLIFLIINLKLLDSPKKGWGKYPDEADLSLSADVLRLRFMRNGLVAHKSRARLDNVKYERKWTELQKMLTKVQGEIASLEATEYLKNKISHYRTMVLGQKHHQEVETWWKTCDEILMLQNKVDELVKTCNEFRLFFEKKPPEKYNQYIRLLFEGGKLVLSGLLKKHAAKQEKNLNHLLSPHRAVLQKHIANEVMVGQIFPDDSTDTSGMNTDTEKWDILVLVSVIEVTLNLEDTSDIHMIRDARLNYADTAFLALHGDAKFSDCCEDLVYSIRSLAKFLDDDIKLKCKQHIDQYRSTEAETDSDIDKYLMQLKSHGEAIKDLSDLYGEIVDKLKKSAQEMELSDICFKTEHVLNLKMVTLGENKEKVRMAEETLFTVWQAAIKRAENPNELESVRREIDKILEEIRNISDVTVTEVKRSSIIISIVCASSHSLLQTIDYLNGNTFKDRLYKLSIELVCIYDCPIRAEGNLTFDCIQRLMNAHVPETVTQTEDKNCGITIPVLCNTPGGMREVLQLMGSKKITNSVNHIADYLSEQANATVSLSLTPDPKAFTDIFEETDSETMSSIESQADESDRYDEKLLQTPTSTSIKLAEEKLDDIAEDHTKVSNAMQDKLVTEDYKRQELKEKLIAMYRYKYATLPIDGISEQIDIPFDKLYVPANLLDATRQPRKGSKRIESIRGMLLSNEKRCRNIFLTAEPGMGKTTVVKWLTLAWCQANAFEEPKSIDDEDECLRSFQFVFLVHVGDVSMEDCNDVDSIIYNSVIKPLHYDRELLNRILDTESCLIILDGIDEAVVDGFPERKDRSTTTFLTTCTTWTYSCLGINVNQVDKHIKIDSFDDASTYKLLIKIMSFFTDNASGEMSGSFSELLSRDLSKSKDRASARFRKMLQEKEIEHLTKNPVIHAHMLSLWLLGEDAGQSLCDVYSKIVNLLMTRATRKQSFERQLARIQMLDDKQRKTSSIFGQAHISFYKGLGLLAYQTLLPRARKDPFELLEIEVKKIFQDDNEKAGTDIFEAGLNAGILVKKCFPEKRFAVEFFDETMHQFFAAMYVASVEDCELKRTIVERCTKISTLQVVSKVIIFLGGLQPEFAKSIIEQIQGNVDFAKELHTHRSTLAVCYSKYVAIQDIVVRSVEESRYNAGARMEVSLNDVFINASCEDKGYRKQLKRLVLYNQELIISLAVDIYSLPKEVKEEMQQFLEVTEFPNLQKLEINGMPFSSLGEWDWLRTSSSLRCILLKNMNSENKNDFLVVYEVLQQYELIAIGIDSCFVSGQQLNEIIRCITEKTQLKQLILKRIVCLEHRDIPERLLDMSSHSQLTHVELLDLPITEVCLNVNALEECHIGILPDGCVTRICECLVNSYNLKSLQCYDISNFDDVRALTRLLDELENLKSLSLNSIDLEHIAISLPSDSELEKLNLFDVSMTATSLYELIGTIEMIPKEVTVELEMCFITKDEECESVEKYMRTSDNFIILKYKKDGDCIDFKFRTKLEHV